MKRIGRYTLVFTGRPWIESYGAVAGKKEQEGPLGKEFDRCFPDTTLGEESWEKAERCLLTEAVTLALRKGFLAAEDLDCVFAGDLMNQCTASAFAFRPMNLPFLGQFSACATMGQALTMAAVFAESGAAERVMAATVSHFCSVERQFRLPLEYGGQRPPTAQWTVTGAGAAVVTAPGVAGKLTPIGKRISIAHATIGRMVDLGVADAANMGAAMAPAAAQTLLDFLEDTGTAPEAYDWIVTGDLGAVGSALFLELLSQRGISLGLRYRDCGLLIYDRTTQKVDAGGSGCGCVASVLCGTIFPKLEKGTLRNLLLLPTGALLSTTSTQQGESIPGISHLVHFVAEE